MGQSKIQKTVNNIVRIYNEELGFCLDFCYGLSPEESGCVAARWRQMHGILRTGDYYALMDGFRRFFRLVHDSNYLMGRRNPYANGRRPFKASLMWLMQKKNFVRILTGYYNARDFRNVLR